MKGRARQNKHYEKEAEYWAIDTRRGKEINNDIKIELINTKPEVER